MLQNIKINQISENEIWVGKNKLSLINDNIIYVVSVGEQTSQMAKAHKSVCLNFSSKINGKTNYLIDLNKCGKNSPEARKTWIELSSHKNTHKVATFGLNPVARVIASFVIGVYNQNNMRFFKTKEKGLEYLLEENDKKTPKVLNNNY